jgi:hypothetical protein
VAAIDAPSQTTWQQDLLASARRVSAGVVGGLATGALIGGVGGRLAMFVLRLTSDPSLHGLKTDDGFTIGRFSGETLFLVLATAALGVIGGVVYLAVRPWLPERWRAALTGVFGGIVGGALFISPDGLDFTLLEPLPLAIVMFIVLPAIYGVAMSLLVERLLRSDPGAGTSWGWLFGLLPLVAFGAAGPLGLGLILLMFGAWWVHRAVPDVASLWRSPTVVWIGRAALLAVTARSLLTLVADIDQIL